jgi:hypothetical protein
MDEATREKFRALVKEWDEWEPTIAHCSMPMERKSLVWPKTIAMGMPIVPLILAELQSKPHWWMLQALSEITNENPCPQKHAGRFPKLIRDWILWGKENGHLPAD